MVDFVKLNYTLSNVNNLLGSLSGAMDDKKNGADTGTSIMNFGLNVINGAVRNEVAYDMRRNYGTNMGFLINNMAGYGSEEANQKGMAGLFKASVFNAMTSPWMFGGGGYYGGGCCSGMYGGMGMCGPTYTSSGIFGGMLNGYAMPSTLATPYFGSGMSVFSRNSFFC